MRVEVEFQDERIGLDVPDGRLVSAWRGKTGVASELAGRLVTEAVENPRGYPALRKAVVPGDRVVIAFGADVPEAAAVVGALCEVLESAGVDTGSTTLLVEPGTGADVDVAAPRGVNLVRHDPGDRKRLAYLASTSEGRRVYLNRLLTDADIVVPVGRLADDPVLGLRGPWSAVFPGLSDSETVQSIRSPAAAGPPGPESGGAALAESNEVSWLLGAEFQLGLVGGVSGLLEAVAGSRDGAQGHGRRSLDEAWGFRAESRAALVVAGVGRPGQTADVGDVARGLETATRLVQHGGRIVILSRAAGGIGPAMRRLVDVDDPRDVARALRGHESDGDFAAARQLARALAWADVYLLSALDRGDVEGLSMIALDRPEEAGRLAAMSGSCLVVSHADLARATVAGEPN